MNALELLRLALSRLRTSRLRAALTMLGVVIGVASVVALVGVGQGTTSNITSRLASLGTNLLTISPTGNSSNPLTLDDAAAVAKVDGVAAVAPELQTSFLTDATVESGLRVAVLGSTAASDLGLDATAIGTDVSIDGLPFRVIGILQPKGGSGFNNPDDQVLVPIATIHKYFVAGDDVRTIGVSVVSDDRMTEVTNSVTALLRDRHELAATDTADFQVFNQTQLLDAASSISATLTLLLGGIASISLIVGGIGIMNIMLVSVRERTREIGIRKAVGARGRDILAQFLIEALTLSLLGGLIGIVLGLAVSALIGQLAGWGFQLSLSTVAAAVLFSLAVGVVFGVWPARQAARLDPINALRYE
jgi:putative ABC transport system permease protein